MGSKSADAAQLSPASRSRALNRLATETFDVLVVGGGVTGCGVALDAATRGLSVALVEKRDYAAGTSSRSSKLIHGGLRYLEHLDVKLVREALHERRSLLHTIAPHLVHAAPFLFPLRRPAVDRFIMGSGLLIYDGLAGMHPAVPAHRHLSQAACLRDVPALRADAIRGGIRYFDAQVDDARFVVEVARTAADHGAVCAAAVRATSIRRSGGRLDGISVLDEESNQEFRVDARVVVNATGVWTTETEKLAGISQPLPVRPSKGIHVVVPRERIASSYALIIPTEKSVLFVLPWGAHWIVGTTDTDWALHLDHPAANRGDIDYLLDEVNTVLTSPLVPDDVVGVYAGLRPLAGANGDTTRVSREHEVRLSAPGLVSVVGGKYTTYRRMAEDTVDAVLHELARLDDRCGTAGPPSCTAGLPLLGARGLHEAPRRASAHPGAVHLSPGRLRRLLERRGALALEVLDLVADDASLAHPLPGAEDHLLGEVRYAASHEGALHIDDVLTRRTHISFEARDRGHLAAGHVARIMAPVLGWDRAAVDREVSHYRARLAAELTAESMPDDASADAVRARVRDLRLG